MRVRAVACGVLSVLAFGALVGCSTRTYTKPRSEVVAESPKSSGAVRTVVEDRRLFERYAQVHRSRLSSLLAARSGLEYADPLYRLGAGDELAISVFDVPELNLATRVSQSGTLNLPLLGNLPAEGMTESELRESLRDRLRKYMHDPQVSVSVSTYASQRVAVLGAVRTPGYYPLQKGSNSVVELLSIAGGVTEKAGNVINFIPSSEKVVSDSAAAADSEARGRMGEVMIRPAGAGAGASQGIEVPLDAVLGTSGEMPVMLPVRGGDVIIVPEAGKVMVEGEVQTIGSYDLGQQMTLLGALAAAGGITYAAKIDEIEVIREIAPGQRASLVVSLEEIQNGAERDVRLRNGDIVRVPSDSGRRLTQGIFESIAKMINVGVGGTYSVR